MTQVEWTGFESMFQKMNNYAQKVEYAIKQVAIYFQEAFSTYAKLNAPWDDQTGHARITLHSWIDELSHDTVELYLSHGVEYGVYLETRFAGAYSIVWPTIQAHLQAINTMLQGIFG